MRIPSRIIMLNISYAGIKRDYAPTKFKYTSLDEQLLPCPISRRSGLSLVSYDSIVSYYELFTQKPLTPSDIGKCLSGPHCHHWISGLFSQYDNNSLKIFTMPLPIEDFPADQKFLRTVISPKIKPDDKDMWNFWPRHCANAITQIRVSGFTE